MDGAQWFSGGDPLPGRCPEGSGRAGAEPRRHAAVLVVELVVVPMVFLGIRSPKEQHPTTGGCFYVVVVVVVFPRDPVQFSGELGSESWCLLWFPQGSGSFPFSPFL